MDRKGGTDWGSSVAILVDWTSILALGRQPVGLARRATYFHLLAQMKVGKAKCLNASDPTELHGWKENAVDDGSLGSIIGSSAKKTCGNESAHRDGSAGSHNSRTFLPKRWTRMAGVEALCFGYFHLCQQMKVTAGRAHRRAPPTGTSATSSYELPRPNQP